MKQERNRIKKLEQATAPRMMEIPQYRCLIDGKEQILRPLDYAYITVIEGREGKIIGKAPSLWEPASTRPDFSALNAAFEGMKTDVQKERTKICESH